MAWNGARVYLYPYATPASFTSTPIDISGYVKGFGTQRGRNFVLDDFEAGSATLTLDNSTGRFTAGNTGVTLNLLPPNIACPGRASRDGSEFVSSGVATAPAVSWGATAGFYEKPYVRATVQAGAGAGAAIKAADGAQFVPVSASTQYSARAEMWYTSTGSGTSGRVNITWYTSAMAVISTSNGTAAALGSGQGAAITRTVTATSPASAAFAQVWVESTVGIANAYTLNASRFGLVLGGTPGNADYPFDVWPWFDLNGVIALEVGIGGGSYQRVFTGVIDSVNASNDEGSPLLATVDVQLSDFTRALGSIQVEALTDRVIDGTFPPSNPWDVLEYLPLTDPQPAEVVEGTAITGGWILQQGPKGTIVFGDSEGPSSYEGSPAALQAYSSTKGRYVAFPEQASGMWGAEGIVAGWVRMSNGLPGAGLHWGVLTASEMGTADTGWHPASGASHKFTLRIDEDGLLNNYPGSGFTGGRHSFTDGEWHHVAIGYAPSISTQTPRVYFDGELLEWSGLAPAWGGNWFGWNVTRGAIAMGRGEGIDGQGAVNTSMFYGDLAHWCVMASPGLSTFAEEQEIARTLYQAGADRLGDGQTELERFQMIQELAGATPTTPSGFDSIITMSGVEGGTSLAEAALDIGRSSGAAVFTDAFGALTMVDRYKRQPGGLGTQYAITESGMLPTDSLEYERTYERLASSATVSSDGIGYRATVSDEQVAAIRGVSTDELATKSLSAEDMLQTASWRLALRKRMGWRVGTVTFDFTSNDDAAMGVIMGWELGSSDMLDFTLMSPAQAPADPRIFFVESIAVEVDVDESRVTWTADLSDAGLNLEIAQSGVLGGQSVLGW